MSDNPFSLWVYLSQSPLLWLTVTLMVYATVDAVSLATHRHPLANPVLHSIWIVGVFLLITGTSYPTYFAGAARRNRRSPARGDPVAGAEIGHRRCRHGHQRIAWG